MTNNLLMAEDAWKSLSPVITDELEPDPPDLDGDADGSAQMAGRGCAPRPGHGNRVEADGGLWAPRTQLSETIEAWLRADGGRETDLRVPWATLAMNAADMFSDARILRIGSDYRALLERDKRTVRWHFATALAGDSQPVGVSVSANAEASAVQMVAVPSEALVAAVAPDLFGPSILATAERLNTARLEQRKKERQHKIGEDGLPELVSDVMEKSLIVTARLLLQITGIADLRQVRAVHLSQFRDALQRLPSVPPRDVGRAVGGYPGCGSNHAGIAPDKPQMIAL